MLLYQTYVQATTKNKEILTTLKWVFGHLQCSKPPAIQDPLRKLKCNQISKHFNCMMGP